jgi:hypothetical protein
MYETLKSLANSIGLVGVVLQLVAYFLLSTNRINSNSLFYQLANMSGSFFILFSLYFYWNTPAVIIESAWLLISVHAVYRIVCSKLPNS